MVVVLRIFNNLPLFNPFLPRPGFFFSFLLTAPRTQTAPEAAKRRRPSFPEGREAVEGLGERLLENDPAG